MVAVAPYYEVLAAVDNLGVVVSALCSETFAVVEKSVAVAAADDFLAVLDLFAAEY